MSLLEERPELVKEWDYEKNKELTPDIVTVGSGKKYGGNVKKDIRAFETFFITANNMDTEDIDWLRDYFYEMIAEELCCGVFIDNHLVSCTDLPAVPFMSEIMKEIGINTLQKYRNQGYAKAACSCTIRQILKQEKCPIRSTGIENTASQRLAESLRFTLLGESFTLDLAAISTTDRE